MGAELNARQRRVLVVMAEPEREWMEATRIHALAFPDQAGRSAAGTVRTLDALDFRYLVRYTYEAAARGRVWKITKLGREAIA